MLASAATQPSTNSLGCPGTGGTNTNNDGDHFFCIPKTAGASANLAAVFQAAASSLARTGAKLIDLYPSPIITGVSPNSGPAAGGATITLTGQYFSGATSVSVGTKSAAFTVTSDTTVTVVVPSGTAGSTVDITVTTPAGSSFNTSVAQYTYT